MPPATEPVHDEATGTVSVITEPLGGSALSRWIQAGAAPSEWRMQAPETPDAWQERIAAVQKRFRGGEWLARIADAITADGAARERLERVAAQGGIVITTGQQPGLFGGPIYTWSKAVTALAIADLIETRLGIPAVPMFWAATDDADLLEAQSVWLATRDGATALRGTAEAPVGTPAAAVPQGDLATEIALLVEAAGSAAHRDVLDVVVEAYADPGRTIGAAYLRTLAATLGPMGIPVLDASHPAVRRASGGLLRDALAAHESIDRALSERAHAIRAAGFEPQVEDVRGLTPVFVHDADGTKRRASSSEADALARASHAELGPNVLLRPVVEAAIVPTAAYVAGPGELAYFAQVTALADALGAFAPLAVPRWSCTLDEPRMQRVLTRLGVDREALADPHRVESALASAAMPEPLRAALVNLRGSVEVAIDRTAAANEDGLMDPAVVDGLRTRLGHQLERFERRAVAAVKRREADLMRDIARARGFYFPGGKRQERALSIVPTLARYGLDVLRAMRHAAGPHADRLLGLGR